MPNYKLIIMIPAYNESETITDVIKSIPPVIAGVDEVCVLVIDDGSDDDTAIKAKEAGADYVISNKENQGLAFTYNRGLDYALTKGADLIVNFDADGQYRAEEISLLIKPLVDDQADLVIGDRQVQKLDFMPLTKKYANRLGTWVISRLAGIEIRDASSGFRAFNKEAALKLITFSNHTYTHESIIDAVNKKLTIHQIPITFMPTKRSDGKSRLISGVGRHIKKSLVVIIRTHVFYKPFRTFFYTGAMFISVAFLVGVRFLYYYFQGATEGKIQSLVLGVALAIVGFQIFLMGFISDAISQSRKLSEEILYRLRKR